MALGHPKLPFKVLASDLAPIGIMGEGLIIAIVLVDQARPQFLPKCYLHRDSFLSLAVLSAPLPYIYYYTHIYRFVKHFFKVL